jgi:sarcosine oxidase subunit alpha
MKGFRITNHPRGNPVKIKVNGRPIQAYSGETLLAVLFAEDIIPLRHTFKNNKPETAAGGFCGMGICRECRVSVDGIADRRACMTEVREGMEVLTDGR